MKNCATGLVLLLFVFSSHGGSIGVSLSKKVIPRVVKEILQKQFKADGAAKIKLKTINIDTSLILTELDDSRSLEIVKEISNFGSYNVLNPQFKIYDPLLTIKMSDELDFHFENIGDGSIRITGFLRPEFIEFKTALIEICDGELTKCKPEDLIKATDLSLQIKNKAVRADFSFLLRKKSTGYIIELDSFKTNLAELENESSSLVIGDLIVPAVSIRVGSSKKEIDISSFKEALLNQKKWLVGLILTETGKYLFKNFSEDMTKLLKNSTIPSDFEYHQVVQSWEDYLNDTNKRKADLKSGLFVEKVRDQIPLVGRSLLSAEKENNDSFVVTPLTRKKQDFKSFLKIAIECAFFSYRFNHFENATNYVGLEIQPIASVNAREISTNPSNLELSEPKGDLRLIIPEELINDFFITLDDANIFKTLNKHFLGEPGIEIKKIKSRIDGGELLLSVNLKIDFKKLSGTSKFRKVINNEVVFFERNNNDSVLEFPVDLTLKTKLDLGKKKIYLNYLAPNDGSLHLKKDSQMFDSINNFDEANIVIRWFIINKIKNALLELDDLEFSNELSLVNGQVLTSIQGLTFDNNKMILDLKLDKFKLKEKK